MDKLSLFEKKLSFKQGKVLKIWPFFFDFLTLRKKYRANSVVVFNRETRFWEYSLLARPQPVCSRKKIKIFYLFFGTFDRFLKTFWIEKFTQWNTRWKVLLKEQVAIIVPAEAVSSCFLYESFCLLGKNSCLELFLLLGFGQSPDFEITLLVPHHYSKLIQYSAVAISFSWAPSCLLSRYKKKLVHLVFIQPLFFFKFFVDVYRKWCEPPLRRCVWHLLLFLSGTFIYILITLASLRALCISTNLPFSTKLANKSVH